jgi:beta-galactosidase
MYVLSYFTAAEEALHLAVSSDGHEFTTLSGGAPILRGQVGTGTLRDPFIGVGPGGLFHLLATDGWTSRNIVHATSSDLRHWSPQRLLPVMGRVPGARNAWAPEFFADPSTGQYHLIWSSAVDSPSDPAERDWRGRTQNHRIWHATTADFLTFGEAALFFDPGYPVIDATVGVTGDGFVMAYKDERGENELETAHKNILLTTFKEPDGPFGPPAGPISPSPVEGPSLFRRGDEWVLIFDHFLEERYGALATRDLTTWRETELVLPTGMRHASVAYVP